MRRRRMTTMIVFVATLSACSGGSDPDPDQGADVATTLPAGDAGGAPTISGAPPATISGQPIDEQPIDEQPIDEQPIEEQPAGGNTGSGDRQDDEPPSDPDTTAPRTTVAPPDEIVRVISLAPTHTETIFALGAEALLVAVDPESDFPDAAIALQNGELRPSTGDTGAIEELQPDLVIVGADPTDLAGRLGAIGIPAWRQARPASVDGVYDQIRELGELLGAEAAADALVAEMQSELAAIRAELPPVGTLTYFHENDPGFITPAAGSFIDLVYGELGLSPIPTTGDDRGGFVQSSSAEVIAGDPDVIVLADGDCCGVSADTAAGRPGWSTISAVRTGAIATVPDAITQRWGPRLVDWWRIVADAAAVASADAG